MSFHLIAKPETKNRLVTSSYVPCARNITSGNLFANIGHYHIPSVAVAASVDTAIVAASGTASTKCYESDLDYGEIVAVSGDSTSDTRDVVVSGEDYLGNPMSETITLNKDTAVAGKKAFKKILSVTTTAGAAVAMTTTAKVGLPFQTMALLKVITNGANDSTAALTAFAQTQTATSNDPRGTVSLAHCSAGDEVEILYIVTEFCAKNADGTDNKGGLFGVKPYAG